MLVFRDTDAGIPDGKIDIILTCSRGRDPQGDGPFRGKFKGVGEQVLQDLLQAAFIGLQLGGRPFVYDEIQVQVLVFCEGGEEHAQILYYVFQGYQGMFQLQPSALDPGQVEDLVDQFQQALAGVLDDAGVFGLFGGEVVGLVL